MKAFNTSLLLLLAIGIFIGVHSFIVSRTADEINQSCTRVSALAREDRWDEVTAELKNTQKIWNSRRMWAALTISTNEIEQIEISLAQSCAFAQLRQKPDFFGEFTMFTMLVEHIPHREGFHLAEIL